MKRKGPKAIPKAWRDARLGAPSVARDPDPSTSWVLFLRVLAGTFTACLLALVPRRGPLHPLVMLAVAVAATVVIFAPGRWLALPAARRGAARRAFSLMRITSIETERRASAVVLGALGLASRSASDATVLDELPFFEQELERAVPRGSEGVLAHALLRALRGDRVSAGSLFALMVFSPPSIFSRFARRVALRWLVANHAREGKLWRIEPLLAMKPRRWLNEGPLASLVEHLRSEWAAPPSAPAASTGNLLERALDAQRRCLLIPAAASSTRCAEMLVGATRAWDELEVGIAGTAGEPSAALGVRGATRDDLERVLTRARSELAAFALYRAVPLASLVGNGETSTRVHDLVSEELFATITLHLEAVARIVSDERTRPEIEEWLEWATVRAALELAHRIGGERVRRGSFTSVYLGLTSYAAWLYNQQRMHLLAHAIFRFLLAEARFTGDEEALRLCASNARVLPA